MDDPMEYSRIKAWAGEWGGRVDYVDYVKRNGDLGVLVAFSRILWPRFIEVGDCVLWDRVYEESNFSLWCDSLSGDTRKIEATLNQLRVWQIVDFEDVGDDREAMEFLAVRIVESWKSALRAEFPGRSFDVRILDSEDGPIVTFSADSK
ncbi:hypothetical protein [Streptomyces sp. NPDC049949]|uniref:hypothetical protein n=1 Tax=Streptomyces sp. NPDC049949 TaxID=3154627 RepID=UPI003432EE5A